MTIINVREAETRSHMPVGPAAAGFADAKADFARHPQQAADLIATTRSKLPQGIAAADFAAWIVTANAILNLDEFLTRN